MRIVSLLLLVLCTAAACTTGVKIADEIKMERQRLAVDEKRGAKICVPFDLANAQSELDFAEKELETGNYIQAEKHMKREKQFAARSTKLADSCIPKDKDADGIADEVDKCPLEPGKEKLEGCPDKDNDGIIDSADKCPTLWGERELNGCPPAADTDKDGISDPKDRCPFDAEDRDGFKDTDGCPDTDNDDDGITDEKDACPMNPGPAVNQGCPVTDKDGDGIPDELDKCPEQPEDKDGFEDQDGCPDTDNDKDTITDDKDKCPDLKGTLEDQGCPNTDKDRDGIFDEIDKCPEQPEDKDSFEDQDGCPDTDNDQDTIPDAKDKCPDDKGLAQNHGCPVLDTDADGVPDVVDKCPSEKEDVDTFQDEDGCPDLDNDKDTVPDLQDKCPLEPGVPEEGGCPKKYKLIVVTAQKIELKQTVYFKTGKAVVDRKSYEMLKEVADAIKSSPGIQKVMIEGHTDNVGKRETNVKLSQERADAVREFLVDEGVDGGKLKATGYGPDKPISSNKTEKGRSMNRRVEFKIE